MNVITLLDLKKNEEKSISEIVSSNLDKKIFYFGELHGKKDVLHVQMAIMRELAGHGSLILGLEMFNMHQQILLDAYLQGQISRDELEQKYKEGPEGFPLDHYGQLLDLARDLNIPVKGLIIPRNIASLVVRNGIEALKEHQELFSLKDDYIPGTKEHEDYFVSLIKNSMPMMKAGFSYERFFQAQVVKDSSMARNIIQALKETEWKPRMLVITGSGHVDYRFGVPERVKILAEREGVQVSDVIITTRLARDPRSEERNGRHVADYLFVTRE